MLKIILSIVFCLLFLLKSETVLAISNSFVSVVNPIRGGDFWDNLNQKPIDAIKGQMHILQSYNISGTWLIRFDALKDPGIIAFLKQYSTSQEMGLFLEITPSWTDKSQVVYHKSASWHDASSVFLTGYDPNDRKKLIDQAFEEYKSIFGFYPKSVGAWYIDSFSLGYMQSKYNISGALIVADQYTTDNYQIWGQYWATPYYPSTIHTLMPAQNSEERLPVVMMQWAARDPLNGYGERVEDSTYSLQVNDYIDYHNLDSNYFSKLIDIFTNQNLNQVNQVVVGLENSYDWNKYSSEYQKQIEILSSKSQKGQFKITNMQNFAAYYKAKFTEISPWQVIVSHDPLGTERKAIWLMNPYYRVGWFYNQDGSVFNDVRQYIGGQKEPCFDKSCQTLNYATIATRVLDKVTYKQKLVIDQGKIHDFNLLPKGDKYVLSYKNDGGKETIVEFLPRDISIDGKVSSIDSFIMDALARDSNVQTKNRLVSQISQKYQETILGFGQKIIIFSLFLLLAFFLPGYLLVRSLNNHSLVLNAFLSIAFGMVLFTISAFLFGLLKASWLFYVCIFVMVIIFIKKKYYSSLLNIQFLSRQNLPIIILITMGTFFQSFSMVRSGWGYDFGIGFLGPTGHDGIWHQALINQLVKQVPPQNPGFSATTLSNYHYFYDLLVAATTSLTNIPITDLLYRFYPILFSLLLGVGSYLLVRRLIGNKTVALISIYFVYFAGSFGWIVEYIRERHFGGESAFWMNQPVSMNLNPPFAISLVIIIAILLMFNLYKLKPTLTGGLILAILSGVLIEFKVYAGLIVLGGLLLVSLWVIITDRKFSYFYVLLAAAVISLIIFLPQNSKASDLLVFAPFWFVHSMVDFPDRVGWIKLSSARMAYFERGDWLKFVFSELLGLGIFIFGNLGTRALALIPLVGIIKKRPNISAEYLFIFSMVFVSIAIPLFFIQKGNPWNTIQFSYYFLYFVSLFTGIGAFYIWKKLPKQLSTLIILFVLIITPINSFRTFQSGFEGVPPARLTWGEFEALDFLKKLPDGVVLTVPFDKTLRSKFIAPYPLSTYETSAYVSAFSAKSVFFEDMIQQDILQNDYQKRLVAAQSFFTGQPFELSKEFLAKSGIRYIYLPKLYGNVLQAGQLNIKQVFENDEAIIYEI